MNHTTKGDLVAFSGRIAAAWAQARIPYPVHLSGGNEEQLLELFREVKEGDYVFSTHRSHYHYLLAGGHPEALERQIFEGRSMHIFDRERSFLAASIVRAKGSIQSGLTPVRAGGRHAASIIS